MLSAEGFSVLSVPLAVIRVLARGEGGKLGVFLGENDGDT